MTEDKIGQNIGKPSIKVRHSLLKRSSARSQYQSQCPVCVDGVLLVRRSTKTGRIEERDRCLGCGQAFMYEDIKELRKLHG